MRGVMLGAGLGALAATKGAPLAKKAMLKYLTSYLTSQAADAPEAAAGPPAQ
jgi:hypothetical protein